MQPPSGTQYELQRGSQRLVAVEVGAGLREYEVDGEAVLDGFSIGDMADGGRGQPLLPWPNRLADGRYEFDGQQLQVPIDEVARNNASHGLTRWLNWSLVEQSDERVCLEHVIHSRPGYPFTVALQVEYALASLGFSVTIRAHNLGGSALPFGAGQHPYFTVGTPRVDEAMLHVPSHTRLVVDAERRLPTGERTSTDGTASDFSRPRAIGPVHLDECYCDLQRDDDGYVRVTVEGPRRTLTLWADEHCNYLQVFSGDTLAPSRRRHGLAIEPMTCPPNAFRTHSDVIRLEPDERIELRWGVDLTVR